MRCLYCGKELALLKRLTGGAEFCSESHRQQYKKEYNDLALSRLLQAKPQPIAAEENAPAAPKPEEVAKPTPAPPPVPVAAAAPVATLPTPKPIPAAKRKEQADPPEHGFIPEMPEPVMAAAAEFERGEIAPEVTGTLSLPARNFEPRAIVLAMADRVLFETSLQAADYTSLRGARAVEMREFPRNPPLARIHLPLAGAPGLDFATEPLGLSFFDPSLPDPPQFRQEPARAFGPIATELGAWGRVFFRAVGVHEDDSAESSPAFSAPDADQEPESDPEKDDEPVLVTATTEAFTTGLSEPVKSSPAPHVPPPPPPAPKPAVHSLPLGPGRRPEPVPDLIGRPMPLTLHGLAAGRGKPVPLLVPTSSGRISVQVPRSKGLPLRPLMTLGPAPTGRSKMEPKQQQQSQINTRPVNGKEHPESKSSVAVAEHIVEPVPNASPRQTSARLPVPLAAPRISMDLGLPSLSVEKPASGLPKWIMIGVGVAVLAGVAVFTLSGTKTGDANPNVIAAGPALAAGESGLTPNWFNDIATDRQRQISILTRSLTFTDYRVEFQAAIQTKAFGWVFRAKNPRNFYVMKLQLVNSGPGAALDLERFAVIDGDEQPHSQVALKTTPTPGNVYKIRFEAVGNRFSTWIQDQKVDTMTDDRIKSGGVGVYRERDEVASLAGNMNIVPLTQKQ